MATLLEVKDFILVGEFCEISGPCSVLTIPANVTKPNNNKNLNVEELLLYIMTTDYQNFPGEKWKELCDVACVRTNILPNCHAVLHYFTLRDPLARGCVRPSCLAYVTQDQNKLHLLKKEILEVLNMSAQILKQANLRWLKPEMELTETKENDSISILLDKWDHLSQQAAESEMKRPKAWTALCSSAIPIVVSGLLKLRSFSSPSLEKHIIHRKHLNVSYELFDRIPTTDIEFRQVMNSLK